MKLDTLSSVYHVCDSILCCVLLFPSMVLYWRGIWDLWGYYTNGQHWVMFAVGNITLLGYVVQPALEKHIPRDNKILYAILIRVYLYIFAAFNMCLWRGVWDIPDHYLGFDLQNNLISYFLCYGILLVSRGSRTCIFPPMFAVNDSSEDVLKPALRFGMKPYSVKYFLDSLFSHFLLMVAIVAWRSMWNIIIVFMFEDPLKTDLYCLVIGCICITIVYLSEEPLAAVTLKAEQRGWWWKLFWEDTLYTIIMWMLGFTWIGSWNLVAAYCLPDIPSGAWACHVMGTIMLLSLQQFGFVSTCGCVVDGAESGREAVFPTYFMRHFFLPSKAKRVYNVSNESEESKGHDNAAFSETVFSISNGKVESNENQDVNSTGVPENVEPL